MNILLTNDDGYHAPGLVAMERVLAQQGHVVTVAPATENSGISGAITYLRPLFADRLHLPGRAPGYMVTGTPVDCVKLAVHELCPWRPDIVISGINDGLNAGVNILYSGTVNAALEAATFKIPSFAVSLQHGIDMQFQRAADTAWKIIQDLLANVHNEQPVTFNVNIPTMALENRDAPPEPLVVPMETNPNGYSFEKGIDPRGRNYFWMSHRPATQPFHLQSDVLALAHGRITVTPLRCDLTCHDTLPLGQAACQPASGR